MRKGPDCRYFYSRLPVDKRPCHDGGSFAVVTKQLAYGDHRYNSEECRDDVAHRKGQWATRAPSRARQGAQTIV